MKFPRLLLALAVVLSVGCVAPRGAAAAESANPYKLPNLISLGGGVFDVFDRPTTKRAVDIRLEHRWGMSLLPMANSDLASWDKWFQIHPFAGIETTSRGQIYGFGGFIFDVLIGKYFVISPNVVVGLYDRGDGKRLGSFVEFRSTMEAGVRFPNEMRFTGYFGHTSNAGLTGYNRGAEEAGVYLHIPTNLIFGN